jgi:HK97 gp10 family phage protein
MNVTARLTGGARMARRLDDWANDLHRAVAPALLAGAERIADEARRLAPVKTGRLRQSIAAAALPGAATAEVQCQAPYGRFVEFGTRRQPARPFLLPAALSQGRAAAQAIADLLRGRIK